MLAQVALSSMSWEAWFTIGTIVLVMGALVTNRISVDVAMVGGLTLLMLMGIIEPTLAVSGFAHPAVIIIGAMFVIAAGLEETGGMDMLAHRLLGRPKSVSGAQVRLMAPVSAMSAVMNTTPIVAAYLPILSDWARRLRISPSKLYLPLSYGAIFGGMCTMIGTSSNITVNELFLTYLEDNSEYAARFGVTADGQLHQQFWWMSVVGVPAAILATAALILLSRWLLPARKPAIDIVSDERKYSVEMMVQPNSPIVGKTIEEAGLRHLPGLYLTEIERGRERLTAVSPETRVEANDLLHFVGIVESVVDLRKIRGLTPATDQVDKVGVPRQARQTVEAVIAHHSPLVGQTVRETQFRTRYGAAIIAVARKGHRVQKKIGDIRLQPGDTLLLVTHPGFISAHRNSNDFYLISQVAEARELRHERAWLALAILGLLVAMLAAAPFHPIVPAFFCAMLMIGTRCVTGTVARKSIRWQVLAVIGAAIGIGRAMQQTGAAEAIAHSVMDACGDFHPQVILFILFMMTSVFAQFITNNGAAVLMFPIAMIGVQDLGLNPEPFALVLLIAAGCNLMTPIAYQTNLMVYSPGGYRFTDFMRVGIPLTILIGLVASIVAPIFYPLYPEAG